MKNADLPAMPNPVDTVCDVIHYDISGYGKASLGLTKREMFAMHAMQGLLSGECTGRHHKSTIDCATSAVKLADALLKELEK